MKNGYYKVKGACELIRFYGHPDSLGRIHYSLHWLADYHPGDPRGEYRKALRGQHFFGVPPKTV